ncbi:denticleless protein homolog isoform X2 [Stegostoma tigrinum]|uniref:denticleless protein homolog isoform X2 n=1 Tax=Stegostoma tigrinum TaxID=3053191 RepID=UPI00202B815A|nr:denticleless protein homolog isoform X2 [Stegostoma tigrinum]
MLFHSVLSSRICNRTRESHSYSLETLLQYYQCNRRDEHTSYGDLGAAVPPFGCLWSTGLWRQVLAVVNEEGIVRLYDTECHNKEDPICRAWLAHNNAVFDLAWVPGEPKLVTASGDQTAKLWDVKASELLGTFKGHQCSLKSVAFGKQETAVFCTGGRDGNIMVWDTRCSKKDGFYRQVKQITGAHNTQAKQTPPKQKKRRLAGRGLAPSVDFQQSVTVVIFRDEKTLISAGAVDGVIKMWDLRKNYTIHHQDPVPVQSFPYPGSSARKLGYSNVVLDSKGSNLFANCTDDNIYMFNVTGLKTVPVATFSGHQNSTFYIKANLSLDDQFLLSGSTDHNAYIWKVSDPLHPPTVLQGHSQEVTCVAWCPSDFSKIATCSDDNTVRIWRLVRKMDVARSDLVGTACQKKHFEKGEKRDAVSQPTHNTPPKSPVIEGPKLLSPQQAACVPNVSGGLPLSSSTPTSAAQRVLGKNCRSHQMDQTSSTSPNSASRKTSIKKWIIKSPSTPNSSPDLPDTSPRGVLVPVEQCQSKNVSVTVNNQILEKKVKRRLDTSDGSVMNNWKNEDNGIVSGISPVSKRCKVGIFCLKEYSRKNPPNECVEDTEMKCCECNTGENLTPASPFPNPPTTSVCKFQCSQQPEMHDKENSSPQKSNWLTDLGFKQKTEMNIRMGRSSNSPASSQSPPVKKRDERTTGSPTQASTRKISSYFQQKSSD